jgi:hypothetical protein
VLWEGDRALLVVPTESASGVGVECFERKMKFVPEALKKSKLADVTFANHELALKYIDVMESQGAPGGKYRKKVEYSELYVNPFNDEPVELFYEGKVETTRGGGDEDEEEAFAMGGESHHHETKFHFWVSVFIEDFEFGIDDEDEDLFKVPEEIKRICDKSSAVMDGETEEFFEQILLMA